MTADSLAILLTSLLLMPSASASAMPLRPSVGSPGIIAPWKSWLVSLRPLSEYCPIEIFSSRGMVPSPRRSLASLGMTKFTMAQSACPTKGVIPSVSEVIPALMTPEGSLARKERRLSETTAD